MREIPDILKIERPSSPNTAYFAPEGLTTVSPVDEASQEFDMPASELAEKAIKLWQGEKRVELISRSEDGLNAHFVAMTGLLRFKDDVYAGFFDLAPGKSGIVLYSASRVGHSDLGTNRKRVVQWLSLLQASL